jgi:hypothetical protein
VRPAPAARRFGYALAIVLNVVFWYLIHRQPGWDVVPFLTQDTTRVLPFVDASIFAAIGVNVVFLVRDSRLVKAMGDLTTSLVSLLAMIRIWQVWPFHFTGGWHGSQWLVYVGLAVATFGVAVGSIVAFVTLLRRVTAPPPSR